MNTEEATAGAKQYKYDRLLPSKRIASSARAPLRPASSRHQTHLERYREFGRGSRGWLRLVIRRRCLCFLLLVCIDFRRGCGTFPSSRPGQHGSGRRPWRRKQGPRHRSTERHAHRHRYDLHWLRNFTAVGEGERGRGVGQSSTCCLLCWSENVALF